MRMQLHTRLRLSKLPTTGGKGKGKGKAPAPASPEASSDSDDIYATHLTTSESEGEHQDPQTLASDNDELVAAQRAELLYKKIHDPSRIRTPQPTTSSPPVLEQAIVLAPPV